MGRLIAADDNGSLIIFSISVFTDFFQIKYIMGCGEYGTAEDQVFTKADWGSKMSLNFDGSVSQNQYTANGSKISRLEYGAQRIPIKNRLKWDGA
jgi:hypothetical protein